MADPTVTSHQAIAPKVEEGAKVGITLDGRELQVDAGQFLIAAAEDAGVFIPRFCYHPRLKPVGMCRMCLVDVTGPRGPTLQPACYLAVTDGMVVDTTSDRVKKAQDGVLEFLLVNHPLDCPVCDKGGECPLQDQTLAYGPGESRFIEEKRHFAKPIALSELVLLDRERCIQCGRCTRFAAEVAGEPLIDFVGRGDQIEVAIAEGYVFDSYFSGNTVQICPVGALTSTPYRFTARPWDLDQVESTCSTCAVGCRVAVQSSTNRVTRLLGMDIDAVNQSWLCDKGRFAYEAVNSPNRLTEPLVRAGRRSPGGSGGAKLEKSAWSEALKVASERLAAIKRSDGPDSIGLIGGARLTNEDAYAWAKLAKGVIGTDSVDAQLGDGLPAELVLGLPRATIDETCSAGCVVVLAGDLREELPIVYLRLRAAAEDNGLPVIEITSQETHVSTFATATLPAIPGEAASLALALVSRSKDLKGRPDSVPVAAWQAATAALEKVGADGSDLVVVLGRGSVAESESFTAEAARAIAGAYPAAKFLPALRRGNVMGALDMGLAPGLLPGRVSLTAAKAWYESAAGWSGLPSDRGRGTAETLLALADGSMKAVILLGADPIGDFPDAGLPRRALEAAELVIAVDCVRSGSVEMADVVLPAAAHHERPGTTTNIEGRVSRIGQKLTPPVLCWPDWIIAAEIAARLGGDLGFGSIADIWEEIERMAPSHSGLTQSVLDSKAAMDGIVVPLRSQKVSLGSRSGDRLFDPMATPGIESVEAQGPISRVGTAEPQGGVAELQGGATVGDEKRTVKLPLLGISDIAPANGTKGSATNGVAPARAAGKLRLVARRRLYDQGIAMAESESLAVLVEPLVARVNPADLETLAIESGQKTRLTTEGGSIEIPVVASPGVIVGVVEITANVRAGNGTKAGAADLIAVSNPVTDVGLEKV
jgi:NADH-quinone oxidoreductase subunit G